MNSVDKYSNTLEQINAISNGLLTTTAANDFTSKVEKFNDLVKRSQFVKVPLVGVFSAGKSSLINVFTEKPGVLPVDTMPETAVAYEIYYDTKERVELYRNGNKIEETDLANIKSLSTTPGDIAMVFMDSQPIKNLQDKGVVLVDMPGIGSGIDRHDAAIMNYINYGTSFVLLVDAEQGSLRGSTLVFLEELKKYNLKPAVLVSKIDKKPESEVKEIIDYIAYQMSKLVEGTPYVSKVCAVNNDLQGLTSYLNGLDADAMLKEKVGKVLSGIINMVVSDLKMQKDLKGQSVAKVESTLRKLEEEINNVQMELPTRNNQADSPEKSCQDILNNVDLALRHKAGDMANMILRGEDQETIKSLATSIIRSELIASFKEEAEQYSSALGTSVNAALEDIAGITITDTDFSEQYGDLISLASEIAAMLGGPWGQVFGILAPFIGPILDIFFGKSDATKLAEIKDKLQDSCFAKVVEDLRPGVYKLVKQNQKRIEEQLKQEVMLAFNKMKDGLKAKMNEAQSDKQAIDEQIAKLDNAIAKLNELSATI